MESWGPVFLRGVPAPFAAEQREKDWKNSVRAQVLEAWTRDPIEEPCQIRLRFLLPPDKAEHTDLDNLLKPAIDAIGSVLFKPARSGRQVVWNADDHWIYGFVATKEAASSEDACGLTVTVDSFSPGETPDV